MIALENGNKHELNAILKTFKNQNGSVNYPTLFAIPTNERLLIWAKFDYDRILTVITVGLTISFETMNLARPMSEEQIIDLAEAVIDTSKEDNLALEDLMLFLQGLTRGKYGVLYESMDIPKFMEKFEVYRQERHQAVQEYRENKHLEYKALGDPTRKRSVDPLDIHLSEMTTKIQSLKDAYNEQKDINKRLREDF